ncbi:MAG: SDR family oxidoreductase [Candidatus Latescibacteria bacterium]|nr:SDR family oxidoreductase [Candidatus Latescibacterota bacterium]
MSRFADKVVIVTGASAGIGRATALAFGREGATVAVVARSEDRLRQVADEIGRTGGRALALPVDVAERDRVCAMVETVVSTFGRVDILVNNAGIGLLSPVVEMNADDLRRVMDVNVYGLIWCTQAVLPGMIRQRAGQIINVSSIVGKRAIPHMSAYCASKFAVQAFSDALRLEVAPYGIDVIVVCPTRTDTEFAETPLMHRGGQRVDRPAMSSEAVADIILNAAAQRKREVIISASGKTLAFLNALIPGLVDWGIALVYKHRARSQQRDT